MSPLQPLSRRTLLAIARAVPRSAPRRLESTAASTIKSSAKNASKSRKASTVANQAKAAAKEAEPQVKAAAENVKSAAEDVAAKAKSAAEEAAAKAKSAAEDATDKAKSTAENAAEGFNKTKATEAASQAASRAAEGLSRVTTAAAPIIAQTAKGLGQSLSRVGGPVGKTAGIIEKQLPAFIYWSRVAGELSKIVFQAQKMSPPSFSTFQTYFRTWYTNFLQFFKTGAWKQVNVVELYGQARGYVSSVTLGQAITAGVIFAECLGFFTVGEMIGRLKVVGYHGEVPHHD